MSRPTREAGPKTVDGKFLFTLYDTHGFPTDLAQEVFQDAGWTVPGGEPHRLRGGDGGAAGACAGRRQLPGCRRGRLRRRISAAVRRAAAPELPRLYGPGGARAHPRHGRRRAPAPGGRDRGDGGGHSRPDAGVRRIRRPDRRYRHRGRPRRTGRDPRHLPPRLAAHRAQGPGDPGSPPRERGGGGDGEPAPAPGPAPAPHRHPSPPRGAAPGAGHPRRPGRLPGGARPPALRLLAPGRHQGSGARADRVPRQRAGAGEHRGVAGRDGPPGRSPERRHGAVRGEVRRPRPRDPDRRLLHRAVRRHPSRRPPARSGSSRWWARARWPPACAASRR